MLGGCREESQIGRVCTCDEWLFLFMLDNKGTAHK